MIFGSFLIKNGKNDKFYTILIKCHFLYITHVLSKMSLKMAQKGLKTWFFHGVAAVGCHFQGLRRSLTDCVTNTQTPPQSMWSWNGARTRKTLETSEIGQFQFFGPFFRKFALKTNFMVQKTWTWPMMPQKPTQPSLAQNSFFQSCVF